MKRGVLDRHFLREMTVPTLAALLLLFQLMVSLQLLRRVDVLLGSAVHGREILELLWDLTPHYLVMALPISVLLGVLVGVGQLAEDRELDALYAAGVAPFRLLLAPAVLGLLGGAVVFWLVAGPEARGLVKVRQEFDQILKLEVQHDVKPGVFYDEITGLTLFAQRIDPATGEWQQVLVNDERDSRAPLLILAQSGHVHAGGPEESLRLDLGDGEAHRQQTSGDDYTALRFKSASLSISVGETLLRKNTLRSPDDEKSLGGLWRAAHRLPEGDERRRTLVAFHRRLGLACSVLAFVWFGLPLALLPAGAAGARARGYLFAVLSLVGYFILLRLGGALGQEGRVPPWFSGQMPNVAFLAIGSVAWSRLLRHV